MMFEGLKAAWPWWKSKGIWAFDGGDISALVTNRAKEENSRLRREGKVVENQISTIVWGKIQGKSRDFHHQNPEKLNFEHKNHRNSPKDAIKIPAGRKAPNFLWVPLPASLAQRDFPRQWNLGTNRNFSARKFARGSQPRSCVTSLCTPKSISPSPLPRAPHTRLWWAHRKSLLRRREHGLEISDITIRAAQELHISVPRLSPSTRLSAKWVNVSFGSFVLLPCKQIKGFKLCDPLTRVKFLLAHLRILLRRNEVIVFRHRLPLLLLEHNNAKQ
jgi:hypothetical protein